MAKKKTVEVTVRFICGGEELWIEKSGGGINVEPTSVPLLDEVGGVVRLQDLRELNYPDGHKPLTLQELSWARDRAFKSEWDAVGKALCRM